MCTDSNDDNAGTIRVWYGDGAGHFPSYWDTSSAYTYTDKWGSNGFQDDDNVDINGITDFAVGDFNNDGRDDVAYQVDYNHGSIFSTSYRTGVVTVLNTPTSWVPYFTILTSDREYPTGHIAAGDFDRDGNLDVALTDGYLGLYPNLNVLYGTGNGYFDVATAANIRGTVTLGAGPAGTGLPNATVSLDLNNKDLNGDGGVDLLTGPGPGGGSRVTGYAGTGLLSGSADELFDFDTLPGVSGGVFVG